MMMMGDEFVVFRFGFFVVGLLLLLLVFLQLCFVVYIRGRDFVGVK